MVNKEIQKRKPLLTIGMVVLYIIIFASSFFPPDLFSPIIVLSGFFLFFLSWGKIKISYLNMIKPLLGIFIIGIIGIMGHESRHILRDISYALTPISLIFIGYWIANDKKMWPHILKILIFIGVILSIYHLIQFIPNPELLVEGSIAEIRRKVSNPGGNLIVLALVFGLFQNRLNLVKLFPKFLPRLIAIPFLFLSFFLSYSRTSLIIAVILSLSIQGFVNRINIKSITTISLLVLSFILIVIYIPAEKDTFLGKISGSLKEVTISDFNENQDIQDNWRGYETYRVLETYVSGSSLQLIIGHGFGALADLGLTINLAGTDYREIPIFHNGYAYIILKTGIIGLICYLFFFGKLLFVSYKKRNSKDEEELFLSRLLSGLTLSLMLSMFVVGGMAEIHDSEYVLLVGFIIGRMNKFNL